MIQRKPLIILASVASAILMSACASNAVPETTVATTEATTAAAETETTEPSEAAAEYTLTEEAKKELENVFKDCFYFEIGHGETQLFTDLSTEDTAKVMCTTFLSPDSYLKKGVYDEGTGYVLTALHT